MIKTSPFNAGGVDSSPGWGTKSPHAFWPKNEILNYLNLIFNKNNKYQ